MSNTTFGILLLGVFLIFFGIDWLYTDREGIKYTLISEHCVDHKVVLRGDGWRAWKIDSTNRPEECD